MIALIQRVTHASVVVDGITVGEVGHGLLALVGVEKEDTEKNAARMLERLLGYRVFSDTEGKMNLCLRDTGGGLLLVPQFTLAADTNKGTRPSFSSAASPDDARRLFDSLVSSARNSHVPIATGIFGAEMFLSLTNHGPVTFRLEA